MTEEEHLQLIEGKLEKAIEGIKEEMKLNDKDIAQLQELYWENYSDFDEYGYEEHLGVRISEWIRMSRSFREVRERRCF